MPCIVAFNLGAKDVRYRKYTYSVICITFTVLMTSSLGWFGVWSPCVFVWSSPFNVYFREHLKAVESLFLFVSILKGSFAGYRILDWQSFFQDFEYVISLPVVSSLMKISCKYHMGWIASLLCFQASHLGSCQFDTDEALFEFVLLGISQAYGCLDL